MRAASSSRCQRWLCAVVAAVPLLAAGQDYEGWRSYGGDAGNSHYSSLDQVNTGNVAQLIPAWSYASARGAALPATSELQVNPIIVDGVLYGRNPLYNVFALEADTGRELWRYDPPLTHVGMSNMRGLTYWEGPASRGQAYLGPASRGQANLGPASRAAAGSGPASSRAAGHGESDPAAAPAVIGGKRILFTTGHYLVALDALSGSLIESFGDGGRVDLRQGLGRNPENISLNAPSPGIIFDNLIIMGSAVAESEGAAPGDIRAYDVVSGKLSWTFHTIPHPGEEGHDSWPEDAWQYAGGANAWAGMSVDRARGVVYIPTGSPTPDFDGSRREGANLFGNSIIALDARSGKRLWHYQTVHHDLWDRDLSSAPTLVTVNTGGKSRDLLAQASKQGVIYLLDRDTGQPVFPIEEVPVPGSSVPTEYPYPTQPQVTLPEPFVRQSLTEADLTDITPKASAHVRALFKQAVEFAYMRPPGLEKTILFPGFYGGANWGGGAYDPETNMYYINATEAPHLIHMEAVQVNKGSTLGTGEFVYRQYCSGCHGLELQGFYPYAPALTELEGRLDKRQAIRTVTDGKGRMMPFGHLSDHERSAVIDYVFARSSDQRQTPAPGAPPAETETAYVFAGYNDFVDDRWYPAVKPPWGTLNAISLADGKRRWQITLGEYDQLSREGVPPTGTRNYGGPVVTAGGLLIIAASSDEKLRIFDKRSGELLWQYQLPAAGYSTPSTYQIAGRQYIVVTCSGGKLGTPTGDQYIAFALPLQDSPPDPTAAGP